MNTIYLTRHGESTGCTKGVIKGQQDPPLTEAGRAQAMALGERFTDDSLAAIYSSPLQRSRDTAAIIGDRLGLDPIAMPAFRERSFGTVEGQSVSSVREQIADDGTDWSRWRPPQGETRQEAIERAQPALEKVLERHPGEAALIVAHGGINRGLLSTVLTESPLHGHRLSQDHACVNEIWNEDGAWSLRLMNDTCHLDAS